MLGNPKLESCKVPRSGGSYIHHLERCRCGNSQAWGGGRHHGIRRLLSAPSLMLLSVFSALCHVICLQAAGGPGSSCTPSFVWNACCFCLHCSAEQSSVVSPPSSWEGLTCPHSPVLQLSDPHHHHLLCQKQLWVV